MSTNPLPVGSLVVAKRTTAICAVGERGVCYEEYRIGDRPGWSFIFERGGYDGFSPDEVDLLLEVTGTVCAAVADYAFQNVTRLSEDFRRGRFAPAFCTAGPRGDATPSPTACEIDAMGGVRTRGANPPYVCGDNGVTWLDLCCKNGRARGRLTGG